jgi:hypothetical protein
MLTAADVTGGAQPPLILTGRRADGPRPDTVTLLPLSAYRWIIVDLSGGKDSVAAFLHVRERMIAEGVPLDRLRLHHQCVDGAPGGDLLMTWPCEESYVRAFAEAFGVTLRLQWKEGGFEGEMLRDGTPTAPTYFETADGVQRAGGAGPGGTRLRFPQKGAPGQGRWCSPYMKKDVEARAVCNDPDYAEGPLLIVTGERREESKLRAVYPETEPHGTNRQSKRVDWWRPIIAWAESAVWSIIERFRVRPMAPYFLGFGRMSCALCIFGNADSWATVRFILPEQFERVAVYEAGFAMTIERGRTVREQADRGRVFQVVIDNPHLVDLARSREAYTAADIILTADEPWVLPAGAYKATGGPS